MNSDSILDMETSISDESSGYKFSYLGLVFPGSSDRKNLLSSPRSCSPIKLEIGQDVKSSQLSVALADCPKEAKQCSNFGGEHLANYGGCHIFKKEHLVEQEAEESVSEEMVIKEEAFDFDNSLSPEVVDHPVINYAEKLIQYSQKDNFNLKTRQRRKSAYRKRRIPTTANHPHKCLECLSSFTCKGNLRFHVKTVHEKVVSYPCPKCDAVFSQKGNFKTHYNTIHLQIRPFECLICEAVFSQKGNLKTHLKKMHYSKTFASVGLFNHSTLEKSPVTKQRGRPPTISIFDKK